jgi:hypothetical protein
MVQHCIDCNTPIPTSKYKIRCIECWKKNHNITPKSTEEKIPWCRYGAKKRCGGEDCACCEIAQQETNLNYM